MNILDLIKQGQYVRGKELGCYNGFGTYHEGAKTYTFAGDLVLSTYTGSCWFLYLKERFVSLEDIGLTDEMINEAFVEEHKILLQNLKVGGSK